MITAFALALAFAQNGVYAGVDLRAKNLPIRQALAQLGKQMNGDTFDVPATIKGTVNAVFINLPYQSAVNRVLAQVGAGCKDVLGFRLVGANNKPIAHKVVELGRIETPVTLRGTLDVRDALRSLFKQVDRSYVLDRGIYGDVNVDADAQPFSTVLGKVLDQVGGVYVMDGDIFDIRGTTQRLSTDSMNRTIERFTAVKERKWATLGRLARTAGITFEIDPAVDVDSRVSLDLTNTPLNLVLGEVLGPRGAVDTTSGICRILFVPK